VVSFTPRPLYLQGKSPWYPLDRRLGGPQSWSGRGGEEKNSQPLLGLESLIIQPMAQHCNTELYQLISICTTLIKSVITRKFIHLDKIMYVFIASKFLFCDW
jgi:hypothetical protein